MVVPTRDRAHTLRVVAPCFYAQEGVEEIVFIDDDSEGDTRAVLADLAARRPGVRTAALRNDEGQGASACRNIGAARLRADHVLFCDGDEMLEPGYAPTCLPERGAGAVSGRRVYMLEGEILEADLKRFGTGMRRAAPFRFRLCELVNGYDILVTNDVRGIHLSPSRVRTGSKRGAPALRRIRWSVHYPDHFHRKCRTRCAARTGVRPSRIHGRRLLRRPSRVRPLALVPCGDGPARGAPMGRRPGHAPAVMPRMEPAPILHGPPKRPAVGTCPPSGAASRREER